MYGGREQLRERARQREIERERREEAITPRDREREPV
jgi:hypothetical protein